MRQTITALLVKFVIILMAAFFSFMVLENNFVGWVLILALIVAAASYVLADLLIMPAFGNIIASTADGVLAAALAWSLNVAVPEFITPLANLILFGAVVALLEYFLHIFLRRNHKIGPH